jgi:hypothetical protein
MTTSSLSKKKIVIRIFYVNTCHPRHCESRVRVRLFSKIILSFSFLSYLFDHPQSRFFLYSYRTTGIRVGKKRREKAWQFQSY